MLRTIAKPSTCLFVQMTCHVCRYLLVRRSSHRPTLLDAGSFETDDGAPLVEALQAQLKAKKLNVSQAFLLLPRGDVDMNTLRLPPASEDELPELVANMVAQHLDDLPDATVHDFVMRRKEAEDANEVLTFSVNRAILEDWKEQFRYAKMNLIGVTFGGIGAVRLLQQVSSRPAHTSVVVTTTDQDTDLAVVENGRPVLFRTIPKAAAGEQFVMDQLADEIHRTLTLEGHPEDESTRVYLIGTVSEQQDAAKSLSERLSLAVSVVNPFDQLIGEARVERPSRYANLIGMACAWNRDAIEIDLLNPRKPAARPGPWGRVAFWGAIAASVLAMAGYLAWEQNADQRLELESQQVKLQRLLKPARKSQTKQAMVNALEAWRANDISWLDELLELSNRIPPADKLTVKSLTMATTSPQRGKIDLSVEVSEPGVRMELEEAIRDQRHAITSKRVTDASSPATSAWQFNATITVVPAQYTDSRDVDDASTADSPSEGRDE